MQRVIIDGVGEQPNVTGDRTIFVLNLIEDLARQMRIALENEAPRSWAAGYDTGTAVGYEHSADIMRRWLVHA